MRSRIALGALPILLLGCISGDNAAGPGADGGLEVPETGGFDVSAPDSTVQDSSTADTAAPGTDAPEDAPQDTTPQPVRITITDGTAPLSGVTVVFQDATGAVITSAATDVTGAVTETVPAGSQVTALMGSPTNPWLFTIVGVEPGDVLSAVNPPPPPSTNVAVSVTSVPGAPPAGTSSYDVAAGDCSSGGVTASPWLFSIYSECESAGTFPLLATALDVNSTPLGFAYQKGNIVPDGGLPDGGVPPFAIGGAWSSLGSEALVLANLPVAEEETIAFTESAGGVATVSTNASVVSNDDGGSPTYLFGSHPGFADFVQGEANVNMGNLTDGGNGISIGALAARGAAAADAGVPFDFSQALPLVTSAFIDSTNPARPTTSWTSSASLAAADGAIAVLTWYSFDQDAGTSTYGTWTILVPPTVSSVQAPSLPTVPAVSAWTPASSASFNAPQVIAVEGSYWSGYAQLRAGSASLSSTNTLNNGYSGGTIVPPLPADGTLKMSAFTYNGD